ncbi:MAG: hypothetical protein RLZZ500_1398 [Bacteroidota bacterium]
MIENFLVDEVKKNNAIQKSTHLVLNSEQIGFSHAMQSFVVGRVTGSTPEELEIYTELRRKYHTNQRDELNLFDNQSWKKEDFKSIPFEKFPQDSLSKILKNWQKKGESASYYALSQPFSYSHNGRKFIFFNLQYKKSFFVGKPTYDEAIIFEKIKGKWTLIDRRPNKDL